MGSTLYGGGHPLEGVCRNRTLFLREHILSETNFNAVVAQVEFSIGGAYNRLVMDVYQN